MEIPVQQEINELDSYTKTKFDLLTKYNFLEDYDNPKTWQNSWFALNEPCDEEVRMWVVVALLVYELEHEKVTPEMIGELEYYHDEIFVKNSFDNVFEELDAKEKCFADLKWCYRVATERGLIKKTNKA